MSTLAGILIALLTLPAIWYERLAGIIPMHYPIFILFAWLVYMVWGHGSIRRVTLIFVIFFAVYYLYSLSFVNNVPSATIYMIMWMSNIAVFHFASQLQRDGIQFFSEAYGVFVITALALGLMGLVALGNPHANPYTMWDKNNFSFACFLGFSLSVLMGKTTHAKIILALSIFVFSRTLLMMYLVFGALYLFRNRPYLAILGSAAAFILLSSLGSVIIGGLGFLGERISGAVSLVNELLLFGQTGKENTSTDINDWRRYFLFIANIDIIINTFPFGTGMGLTNYFEQFDNYFVPLVIQPSRAHNFVISYLAEMGVFFFPFIGLLAIVVLKSKDQITKLASCAIFVGLLTNEYITAPMVWFLLGLCINTRTRGEP
tara:strand:- start:5768 stop:6889 length:1122 start_codon:yes stop_codon:yes gene_type:complete